MAFAGCLGSIYIVGIRRRPDAPDLPFEATGKGGPSIKFGIGFYNMVPRDDDRALARVKEASEICLRRCIELGGRPYLYGWHQLDPASVQRLYDGEDLERLATLKREIDPYGTLKSHLGFPGSPAGDSREVVVPALGPDRTADAVYSTGRRAD